MAYVDSKSPLKKDTIYIDVDDDITGVIDKLKNSNEKIVALVPPKGNAVLQSTVNLKLLSRAAKTGDKQPVIVTNNSALMALAGGLGMYVAKNLQSKPYIPSEEDQTEPADEAVDLSEVAGTATVAAVGTKVALNDGDELEVHADELAAELEDDAMPAEKPAKAAAASAAGKAAKKDKNKKVPNFNNFKKKLLIFGGLGAVLLVILFLLIARPKATISVRAETTPVDIAYEATILDSGSSNPETYVFRAEVQEENKTVTQDFTPTGKKNIGEKASGTVSMRTCIASTSAPSSVPAGTTVTTGGKSYVTSESATFSLAGFGNGCVNYDTDAVSMSAQKAGASYNVSNATFSVSGRSNVSASGSASGGTDKTATVVAQADVDKATEELKKKDNEDVKKALEEGFGDDVVVLSDSFTSTVKDVKSEPAVGQEANEGKLTAQVEYTMMAVKKSDLKATNKAAIKKEMDNPDQQQVYKDGVDETEFEKIKLEGTSGTYKVTSVGQYGPKFDTNSVAEAVANKKVGEVRSYIQDLPGVKSVEINTAPFWSRSTPGADKIEIKLVVDENTSAQ